MHDGTAAPRTWCCTETWTAIQECCIVSKKSKKPLKSLLKPIFHLLKPLPPSAGQCEWFNWNAVQRIEWSILSSWHPFNFKEEEKMDCIDQLGGVRVITGAACNPRLALSWIRCQKSRYPHQHTIQSYFYFRYINANDNLLFIIHQYHFLSFSHHWELFHNQMEKKEVLRWDSGSSWPLE